MKNRTAKNVPQTPDEYRALAVSRQHIQRLAGDSAAPHDLSALPTEAELLERRMQRRHMYAALAVLALVGLALVLMHGAQSGT